MTLLQFALSAVVVLCPCHGNVSEVGERQVLLVGNGLTFNSGGLCLKHSDTLPEQRASMAGAACVVAILRAAAAMQLPMNISGVIPLCENMPTGHSFRPGDNLTSLSGTTIVPHDTNNAGVLMLADTLEYFQKSWIPRLIVMLGALSDGVQSAFGGAAGGTFVNSTKLWQESHIVNSIQIKIEIKIKISIFGKPTEISINIDICSNNEIPCLATAFLQEFIVKHTWLHLDIRGVLLLIQFLYQLACKSD